MSTYFYNSLLTPAQASAERLLKLRRGQNAHTNRKGGPIPKTDTGPPVKSS